MENEDRTLGGAIIGFFLAAGLGGIIILAAVHKAPDMFFLILPTLILGIFGLANLSKR